MKMPEVEVLVIALIMPEVEVLVIAMKMPKVRLEDQARASIFTGRILWCTFDM